MADVRGTPLRDGVKMADGTLKKYWWKSALCPYLAEYCKGPRCMMWDSDRETCAIVGTYEALKMLVELSGSGGEPRDIKSLIAHICSLEIQ